MLPTSNQLNMFDRKFPVKIEIPCVVLRHRFIGSVPLPIFAVGFLPQIFIVFVASVLLIQLLEFENMS